MPSFGLISRHMFGNGGLDACRSQRKGQSHNRGKKLINAHAFFADILRQEDSIKKPDDPGDDAGGSQDDRTGDDWILFQTDTLRRIIP